MEPYYVTTPIYYVNSTPHIGHAYTTVAADVFARHQRQRGRDTFLLTGVDEHASKVARVAEEQGLAPQEYADRIVEAWRALPARLGVAPDFFIRTSDDGHKRFVQEFLERIRTTAATTSIRTSTRGSTASAARRSRPRTSWSTASARSTTSSPSGSRSETGSSGSRPTRSSLLALYDERPDFVLPAFRANEARSFIAGGLQDFSISREGLSWGIPIPWDPDQVAYVWADALVNYLSALTYARPGEDLVPRFWPAVRHLLAKDILRFHCVYWPAMLLAAGYDVPRQLFVHGYLLLDDRKISKSLGNVVDPLELSTSTARMRCASGARARSRSARTASRRSTACASATSASSGTTSATCSPARRRWSSATGTATLAAVPSTTPTSPRSLRRSARTWPTRLDAFDLTGALERIWEVVRALNRHVEVTAPWQLAKDDARAEELDRVLYDLVDGLRAVAVALAVLPPRDRRSGSSPRWASRRRSTWERGRLRPHPRRSSGLEPAPPLFPRVDEPTLAA